MKLAQLFSIFTNIKLGENPTAEINSIEFDSRKVTKSSIFVAIRGEKMDAHQFLAQVCQAEVSGLVVEDESMIPQSFKGAVAVVTDTRQALNQLAHRFYGEVSKEMFMVGVTGTNGKTTTTHMIEVILNEFGWPTGVMGTINHHFNNHVWSSEMTTPDPITFNRRLKEFQALGAKAVCLEVSSHALEQCRVDEVQFDAAVFTNLTRDHLDYHGSVESYFKAKEKLFVKLLPQSHKPHRTAVINIDDESGKKLSELSYSNLCTYGKSGASLSFKILESNFQFTRFELQTSYGQQIFELKMIGLHNVYNACAAIGVGLAAGASLETCARALSKLKGVSGRLDFVENSKDLIVFVDYAHTDDALMNSGSHLQQIRMQQNPQSKIYTVFGCGGDRDKGKRPLMLKAALRFSDYIIVTSDNPRTEDPQEIIKDILKGKDEVLQSNPDVLKNTKIEAQIDRRKAIEMALQNARPHDIILIAGKGHEDYQIIGTTKHPFSDAEVVREFLK